MNDLIKTETVEITSLQIAKLTGKNHKEVLRDVRKMLDELELNVTKFGSLYLNSQNKEQPMFILPKELGNRLILKYNLRKGSRKSNHLYLISDGIYTKIGISLNPTKRLRTCQTGNAKRLFIMFEIEVDESLESADKIERFLHDKYRNKLIRGEWYKLSKSDIKSIKLLLRNDTFV